MLECGQQREREAGGAGEVRVLEAKGMVVAQCNRANPAGLAVQASLCISILPTATCLRPQNRLPVLVSGGCWMATREFQIGICWHFSVTALAL